MVTTTPQKVGKLIELGSEIVEDCINKNWKMIINKVRLKLVINVCITAVDMLLFETNIYVLFVPFLYSLTSLHEELLSVEH